MSAPQFDAATHAQVIAADPALSTWLSANAGSGKTRVLTNRVARLLLDGVPPERILCLTYTKAAATEMQNRLFGTLGAWAMMDEAKLSAELTKLGIAPAVLEPSLLAQARRLFARAIEAPGGLKIQTIHSFCAAVLRRFPLEAQVAHGFTEMDDAARAGLIRQITDDMAQDGARGQAAIDGVALHLSDFDLRALADAVLSNRAAFDTPITEADLRAYFGIAADLDMDALIKRTLRAGDADICNRLVQRLDPSKRNHSRIHRELSNFRWSEINAQRLADLESLFVFKSDATKNPDAPKGVGFISAAFCAELGDDFLPLCDLMERLAEARPLRRALETVTKSTALHGFAQIFLPAYDAAKEARGWLDFDDLIRLTGRLLTRSDLAQWVLFRLDGGIDHLLVDEAQDTSPAQWQIIQTLAAEFAAGQSARENIARTIFVVGDQKQSIYSFQGADPAQFDAMRRHFQTALKAVGGALHERELRHSFRSSSAVLQLVDEIAKDEGGAGLGDHVGHLPYHETLPGRVDLWPAVATVTRGDFAEWDDPVDLLPAEHHVRVLARAVADFIKATLDKGVAIQTGKNPPRAVTAGDFLILLRKRSDLFHAIISEVKKRGLPIMGADRLKIGAELAVRDLGALLAFLATPEDDLALACVLRSPLGGLGEADLFHLAHDRQGFLWRALQNRKNDFPELVAMLETLRDRADFLRPYEILELVLTRFGGRRKFIARLGPEAEDGIDATLAQAMDYESNAIPSIAGFAAWLARGEVVVKRDAASQLGQVRVMSIHGAKGLEAPIVILPDMARHKSRGETISLLRPEGGPILWVPRGEDLPAICRPAYQARREARIEEENRLLYVAMTRAESWLVMAAAGEIGKNRAERKNDDTRLTWYRLAEEALPNLGAAPHEFGLGTGLRFATGQWPEVGSMPQPEAASQPDQPSLAPIAGAWLAQPCPPSARAERALSPSDLGDEASDAQGGAAEGLLFDNADQGVDARLRGTRVHLLLEHLPQIAPAAWAASAAGLLAHTGPLTDDEITALLDEAQRVLTAPQLAALFASEALAEVPISAYSPTLKRQLYGFIDRLILAPDRILAVDFKTNRMVPERPEDVSQGYARQMGAYCEMLERIYPDRAVEVAILWTKPAHLMVMPRDLIMAALQSAAGA